MNLTTEQLAAIKSGEAVPVEIDHTRCVLIRLDVYEKVKQAIKYDDGPWSDEEMNVLAERMYKDLDGQ